MVTVTVTVTVAIYKFVGAWQKKNMEMCMRYVFSCECKSVCQVLATYVFDAFKCRVRYLKLKPA